jgi:hypothetical protein
MSAATILVVLSVLLPVQAQLTRSVAFFLSPQSEQTSQTPSASSTTGSNTPATTSKPCSASSNSASKGGCKPATTTKKPKSKKQSSPSSPTASDNPNKTVVRNGSTTDSTVSISSGMSEQQAAQDVQSTGRLLASAEANLKAVSGRQLNKAQQDTVAQIKSFMEQAKAASSDGDVQRAYNLANKANMLSADLKVH